MTKVFKYVFCALVVIGVLGEKAMQSNYSSPVPDMSLGRTVATWDAGGATVYVTPLIDHLTWAWFFLCTVTFLAWSFWPGDPADTLVCEPGTVSAPVATPRFVGP